MYPEVHSESEALESDVLQELLRTWRQLGSIGQVQSQRSGHRRNVGGSVVLVKDGPFPDVLWPFGEENCKARTKILALRVEAERVLRKGSVRPLPKGEALGQQHLS